ncbi:LacI family DNA-binding transcriptional regulator [Fimbriimonas ginsengisoli]|nr:GntR family transcriptional regulator [Fimbriimonas ginsengisoli]
MTWRKIADELTGRIESGELTPGTRVESEEEMAARLGVSRHTAHRAMHELQRQGLVVRQRRWGTVVAAPKLDEKKRIAYLVDFAANRFQADIMTHIEHALEDGTRLMVATSRNDLEREAEHLMKLQGEVDGIICYPSDGDANAQAFRNLADSGYPIVLVDRAPRGCEDLVVLTDNVSASQEAVADLISRGHQRIAFFGSNNDYALSIRERFIGYRAAVEPLGYPTRPYERWIPLHLDENSEMMYQSISDALIALRALPEPPTAAFCVQDWLTVGLLEACAQHGLEVGVDFGIATFNDFGPMFFRQSWRLDRIVQQMEAVSVTAVERLRALMRGESLTKGPVRVPAKFHPAEDSAEILASSLNSPMGAITR